MALGCFLDMEHARDVLECDLDLFPELNSRGTHRARAWALKQVAGTIGRELKRRKFGVLDERASKRNRDHGAKLLCKIDQWPIACNVAQSIDV